MNICELIEDNVRNIFLQKPCMKLGRETSFRPFCFLKSFFWGKSKQWRNCGGALGVIAPALAKKLSFLKVPCFLSIQSDGKTISPMIRFAVFIGLVVSLLKWLFLLIKRNLLLLVYLLTYLFIYLLANSIAHILSENIPCYDLCKNGLSQVKSRVTFSSRGYHGTLNVRCISRLYFILITDNTINWKKWKKCIKQAPI